MSLTSFLFSYTNNNVGCLINNNVTLIQAFFFFPANFRFFPTRRNINSWKLDKEIKKSLVKIIERRRKENACGKEETKRPTDLLGLMIWASNNNNNTTSNVNVTVDDIVEECKTFFFAGKHTTSNLLTWTTILLAMHPQWQIRAREELVSVCGARHIPTKEDLAKLKTVSNFFPFNLIIG